MRILVVGSTLVNRNAGLWRAVAARDNVTLRLVGTPRWPTALIPWVPSAIDGVDTTYLEPRSFFRTGSTWWYYPRLKETVREFQPDIVHVLSEVWGFLSIQGVLQSTHFVAHGADNIWTHGGRLERRVRSLVAGRVLRNANAYVSWNSAGLDRAREHGYRTDGPTLVTPAALPEAGRLQRLAGAGPLSPLLSHLRDSATEFILYAGRLDAQKGAADLVHAWRNLNGQLPAHLVVLGSGEAEADLARTARRVPRITFHPAVAMDEMPAWLDRAALVVVPSRTRPISEQFGLVALEAVLLGTPTMVSESGALPDIVHDENMIFPCEDPEALAERLRWFFSLAHADRHAAAAREKASALERFSPSVLAGELEALWRRVLSPVR